MFTFSFYRPYQISSRLNFLWHNAFLIMSMTAPSDMHWCYYSLRQLYDWTSFLQTGVAISFAGSCYCTDRCNKKPIKFHQNLFCCINIYLTTKPCCGINYMLPFYFSPFHVKVKFLERVIWHNIIILVLLIFVTMLFYWYLVQYYVWGTQYSSIICLLQVLLSSKQCFARQ